MMARGILLKLLSMFGFSLVSVFVKLSHGGYPIGELVFFRSFFALAVLIGWLAMQGAFPTAIFTRDPVGHFLRGLIGVWGMVFSFISLGLLPLADATAIGYASPLIVVVLAALLLGEQVRIYRWSAVAAGFLGVMVMLWEHLGADTGTSATMTSFGVTRGTLGSMTAIIGAACAAGAAIQTRRLTLSEGTGAIVFYFSGLTTIFGALFCLAAGLWPSFLPGADFMLAQQWVTPDWHDAIVLVMLGVAGGFAQIFMTESFRHADASIIACFDYTSMIWAVMFGLLIFGEQVSPYILIGGSIVVLSGMFVIWRERMRSAIAGSLTHKADL